MSRKGVQNLLASEKVCLQGVPSRHHQKKHLRADCSKISNLAPKNRDENTTPQSALLLLAPRAFSPATPKGF